MENFVRDYGTGNAIPDPPAFVNYANPDAVPPSSQRPTTRPASFHRSSQRARPPPSAPSPPPQDDGPPVDNTGIGSGARRGTIPRRLKARVRLFPCQPRPSPNMTMAASLAPGLRMD